MEKSKNEELNDNVSSDIENDDLDYYYNQGVTDLPNLTVSSGLPADKVRSYLERKQNSHDSNNTKATLDVGSYGKQKNNNTTENEGSSSNPPIIVNNNYNTLSTKTGHRFVDSSNQFLASRI